MATESGILHQMIKDSPNKTFIAAHRIIPVYVMYYPHMKLNTLKKLYNCLKYEQPEILLSLHRLSITIAPTCSSLKKQLFQPLIRIINSPLQMKIKNLLIAMFMIINVAAKAQNSVTIPDANFVAYLQANYAICMNGNLMDTTCTSITSTPLLNVSFQNISDLTGLQYFTGLTDLNCGVNQLTSLPSLPANIQSLNCYGNQLPSLPSLPANLINLICYDNQLTSLPNLPANLQTLYCFNNQLTSLPSLPANLQYLVCSSNQLTSLPSLPANLRELHCPSNQLPSLPSLPANLYALYCDSNNIACFPIFPISLNDSAGYFSIAGNPFTCLPNYVSAMDANTLAYPLCVNGDTMNNNAGCASAEGIVGYTYRDNNSDCIKNIGDSTINNFPLNLYDSNNNLLAQTYSIQNGIYNFAAASGTYTVKIDTAGMPFTVQCTYPGIDSTVVANPLASDVNFSIACKPGFDIGVQSVIPSGWVFPGQPHTLRIVAGDMGGWYNLNCAAGVSGQVTFIVTGPVTYSGIVAGAITPIVAGNVFTYTIANFDSINTQQAFGLMFTTDTTAQASDVICVNITVTPVVADNIPSNNTYDFCYSVINSYDPNMKEVYPVNVLPGFQDWFTYTIHFQNTGTAPAFNIRLIDTLSAHLDLASFQIINYSHINVVALNNNELTFRFPNIMLPDSTTNLEGSKGFVQYRIKPKPNLPLGTAINNTAYIYFDYNTPIITNTTTNEYQQTASIGSQISTLHSELNVYPNPGTGNYLVKLPESINGQLLTIEVYNTLGELVLSIKSQNNVTPVDLSNQPVGIYFVKVNGLNKSFSKRIVKQ